MQIQPYLFFDGRCEEAIEYYRKALGAKVNMLLRYKDNPEPPEQSKAPPGSGDKVMHASLSIGETMVLVSDGHCTGKPDFQGFGLSLTVPDVAEADARFTALADGVTLERCEIEHSIVLERARIHDVPSRIESSLIGREVEVRASGSRPRTHRLVLGDASRVELA